MDRRVVMLVALLISAVALAASESKKLGCLSDRKFSTISVIDENTLLFKGRTRNNFWVNRTTQSCRGAEPKDRMSVVKYNMPGRICSGDRIEIIKHMSNLHAGTCSLGMFEKIDREQAEALMDEANARQSPPVDPPIDAAVQEFAN